MENILSKLDEAVFTDELKKDISNSFNEAVDLKVELLVAEKVLAIVEEKEKELDDKFISEINKYKEKILENLDEFLDLAVDEYIKENKITIEESVQGEKLEALLEGFNALLVAGGVELKQIAENLDKDGTKEVIEENTNKIDSLILENIELKKQKNELIKMGLIAEVKEGMSVVQKEKFDRLVSIVEFDGSNFNSYLKKLESLKESVMKRDDISRTNTYTSFNEADKSLETPEHQKIDYYGSRFF